MKTQIRRGVFETNSSSMHSFTVMKREDKYTKEEILNGIYLERDADTGEVSCVWKPWIHDMEFGRSPFRAIGTFADKWLYACASLVHEYNDEVYKELVSLALKYIPGLKKIKLPMGNRIIANKDSKIHENNDYYQIHGKTEEELKEYLLQKGNDWEIAVGYWEASGWWHYEEPYTGCVDEDILSNFLKKENISLEEYLINKKYIVIQDGDEYCYWKDMKRTGLVNMETIDHEYPEEDWE